MLDNGFFKIHRKIKRTSFWPHINERNLAIFLIMEANWDSVPWQARNGDKVTIKRGQLVTSFRSLAKQMGISIQNIRTCLKNLSKADFLTHSSTQHYTKITLKNYDKYQGLEEDLTHTLTHTQHRNKKVKKIKNTYSANFEVFWSGYPNGKGKYDASIAWDKLSPGTTLQDKILKAVMSWSQTKEWMNSNGQFVPMAATWLNGRRWEDELPGGKKSNGLGARHKLA